MNEKEIKTAIIGVLTTALETKSYFPESMAYLALNMNLENWYLIKDLMLKMGVATFDYNNIQLTDKGINLAIEFNKLLAEK